ncbi:YciI family protein [Nocardia sp. NPDC003963]
MRFLMMLQLDPTNAPAVPEVELAEAVGGVIEEMVKAGVLLDTNGLRPPEEGVRLAWSDGKMTITDGPYGESKEIVGGFLLLQTKSKGEAVEWGSRFLKVHGDTWRIAAEIRQIDEELQ